MFVLGYSLDFKPVFNQFPRFLRGSLVTLGFSILTVLLGTMIGFLINLGRISEKKWLRSISAFYISIFRGTPSLIQLYLFFYGVPLLLGWNVSAFAAGLIALSLNSSAYVAEIFRSGISSVDPGQMEACRSMGFSKFYSMRHVVFPQAFRNIIPAIGNEFVTLVKESSIVSLIGIADITHVADAIKASTYRVFEALIVAALIYYVITTLLTLLIRFVEKRLNNYVTK